MQLFDPNNPNERKKAIIAAVLAVVSIAILGYVFFGSSGSSVKPQANKNTKEVSPQASPPVTAVNPPDPHDWSPIPASWTVPAVAEADRNIFAFYEPTPTPMPVVRVPPPSPIPTPPIIVSAVAPANVYARTADFNLEVMGDKFTPGMRIQIDGRDMPTRFVSAQHVATTVPASVIANPGVRQVMVHSSSDSALFSNLFNLSVTPPPVPNYSYVGIIGRPRANDIAVLQDKSTKELLNVQRGDVLAGRFRVTSISERELVLTDTALKIRHTISFTTESSSGGPFARPTPRRDDDEP